MERPIAGLEPTCMWVHANCDLALYAYAHAMSSLVHLHVEGASMMADAGEPAEFGAGACSLFHYVALALGMDPATVHRPLAHLVRAANTHMPAHLDPDRRGKVANYYVRLLAASLGETQGTRLYVGSTRLGGSIVEVPTDLVDTHSALLVAFDPSTQIHWVDTDPAAVGGPLDPDFIRDLSFDNLWLASVLTSGDPVAVRMAPLSPQPREAFCCTQCMRQIVSPHIEPSAWLDHFCAAVQDATGRPRVCLRCVSQVNM